MPSGYLGLVAIQLIQLWNRLNQAMGELLEDYSLVGFLPLNIYDPESLSFVLSHIDQAVQYGYVALLRIQQSFGRRLMIATRLPGKT